MNAEDVIAWREALIKLSDQHFFDLMRMYLGAIKTPFNKQRLIEELSCFLRKKENKEYIIGGLDQIDILILAAINELPTPTQPKIIRLFSEAYSFPVLYERILNLEERLLIYRRSDADTREYSLNPLLQDALNPLLGFSLLVAPVSVGESVHAHLRIDDLSLSAIYSFFMHEGESIKNDGSFRKKTTSSLQTIFSQLYADPECFLILLTALQNLGLLVKSEGRLAPDLARWEAFALLTSFERTAYLIVSAEGRYPRDILQQKAQVFQSFFSMLEGGARYTRETLSRLALLVSEKAGHPIERKPYGRFATIMRDQDSVEQKAQKNGTDYIGLALAFGLLVEEEDHLVQNSSAVHIAVPKSVAPNLLVSPSLSVTLLPGFSLAELIPLTLCMEVRDIQIAGQFEITRKSCATAFEQGLSADSIIALFKEKSKQNVPQNVVFSIQDWYRNYSSVSLYHGYVLRVDESRRVLFENNEHLSSLIRKTIGPGIYLLDSNSAESIQEAFVRANIDFLPSVSSPLPKHETVPLPSLSLLAHSTFSSVRNAGVHTEISESHLQEKLTGILDSLHLDSDLHEALQSRIERKIVLNPAQLDPDSVRIEKIEARGMDFLGKVRIAEYALASGAMLELMFDEKEGNRIILGKPISTEKRPGVVLLNICTEPDQIMEQVSLGKAAMVRRIRGSIFSEPSAGRA